jgi:hypothetical protein
MTSLVGLLFPLISVAQPDLAPAQLDDAGGDDDEEGDEFAVGEDILDEGGPFDLPAVDKGQDTWRVQYTRVMFP